MTSRLIIGTLDRVGQTGVTLVSAAADPAFPAANLATNQPGEVMRTSVGTTTASILIDLGTQVAMQAFFLGNTNLTSAGTWRIRLSTADATGVAGNALDTTTVNAGVSTTWKRALFVASSSVTGRYLLVNLTDATLPYLEAGILRALVTWNPARGYRFGSRQVLNDYSKVKKGPNGQQWPLLGPVQRGVQFSMPVISLTEYTTFGEPFERWAGVSRDILVCLDNTAADLGSVTYFGLKEQVAEYERFAPGFYAAEFRLFDRV
jgi:hypothetical protein